MSNDEYRAEQAERRQHGLKARHELRLENATYTAADVKVLTEAAFKLGRKEAADDIVMAFLEFEASDIRGRADINIDRAIAMAREIGKGNPND